MTEAGERWETVRIVNDVEQLTSVMARAGEAPEVVPLTRVELPGVYRGRIDSLRRLMDARQLELDVFTAAPAGQSAPTAQACA
jgi:hypothetical protein